MKYIHFLLLLSLAACTRQPADHFVLRGTVPGAVDSTTVSLRISSGNGVMQKIESYIIGEKFELSGKAVNFSSTAMTSSGGWAKTTKWGAPATSISLWKTET